MNRRTLRTTSAAGFTITELMVAAVVSTILLGVIVLGGVALQRTFNASDSALKASADQSRILDFIVRDLRQALTATVTNGGQTLTLTTPDYIDTSTNLPRIPSITPATYNTTTIPKGVVDYGNPGAPLSITYFPTNNTVAPYSYAANGAWIVRQVGTVQTVISLDSTSLQLSFVDNTNSVTATISYLPQYTRQNTANARSSTLVSATTVFRNNRRN